MARETMNGSIVLAPPITPTGPLAEMAARDPYGRWTRRL